MCGGNVVSAIWGPKALKFGSHPEAMPSRSEFTFNTLPPPRPLTPLPRPPLTTIEPPPLPPASAKALPGLLVGAVAGSLVGRGRTVKRSNRRHTPHSPRHTYGSEVILCCSNNSPTCNPRVRGSGGNRSPPQSGFNNATSGK